MDPPAEIDDTIPAQPDEAAVEVPAEAELQEQQTDEKTDEACMSVTIARYDAVNYDDQTWCVGFNITCLANGRTTYMDTIVKRENNYSDIEIVEIAWLALKERADAWCNTIESKAAVIGITFRVA